MKLVLAILFILLIMMPTTILAQGTIIVDEWYRFPTLSPPIIYSGPPIYINPPVYINPPIIYHQTLPHPIYITPPTQYWHNGYWYRGEHTGYQWLWSNGHWSTTPYCTR